MVPSPLIPTFSAPEISTSARCHLGLRASNDPTGGKKFVYWLRSGVPSSRAPASRCSITLDFNTTVPERYVPGGKRTCPPPAVVQASIALLMATVSRAFPSPTAPKSRTLYTPGAASAMPAAHTTASNGRSGRAMDAGCFVIGIETNTFAVPARGR
jgi:hypothetical protein